MPTGTKRFSRLISIAVLCAASTRLQAATKENNNFSLDQPASWVGSIVPNSNTLAVWDHTVTIPLAVVVNANVAWQGIVITDPGGAQAITYDNASHGVTLGASGIDMSAATENLTISSRLTLAVSQSWNVQTGSILLAWPDGGVVLNGATLTIIGGGGTSVILAANNNTSAITMSGTGLLDLSGNAQHSGLTTVNGGTLAAAGGLSPNSNLILNGGVLQLATDDSAHALFGNNGTITTSGGARTLTLNQSTNVTAGFYTGLITGSLHLTQISGIQHLMGTNNTYTGVTTAIGGTLGLRSIGIGGQASSMGQSSAAASNLILTGGAQLTYDGDLPGTTDRLFTVGAAGTGSHSATLTWTVAPISYTNTGAISFFDATSSLTLGAPSKSMQSTFAPLLSGAGRPLNVTGIWKLTNTSSSYTGPTTITGTVIVDALANGGLPSPIGAATNAATNLILNSGGTLKYTGPGASTDRLFSGSWASLDASGTGPLSFVNNGVLQISNSGTLVLTGTNTDNNVLASSFVGPSAQLIKSGVGTWALTNTSTYAGNTTLFGGKLILDFSVSNLTTLLNGSSTLSLAGGELVMKGRPGAFISQSFAGLQVGGGESPASISMVQNGATFITLGLHSISHDGPGGTVDFNVGGGAAFQTSSPNEAGTILGGWATFNRGVDWATVSGGNIVAYTVYSTNVWSATANTTTTASAAQANATTNSLRFNAAVPVTLTLSGLNTISSGGILITSNVGNNVTAMIGGTVRAAAGKELIITQNNTSAPFTLTSSIVDNGATAFTSSGRGTVILGARNAYMGTTTVLSGTLKLGAPGALPFNLLTVNGTLDLNGFDASVPDLVSFGFSSPGLITNTSLTPATFNVNTETSTFYFWGTINGNLNLKKDGTGEWLLISRQHYTGDTIIANGKLTLTPLSVSTNGDVGANILPPTSRLVFDGGQLGASPAVAQQHADNALVRSGDSSLLALGSFPAARIHITNMVRNPGATLRFFTNFTADGLAGGFVDTINGVPTINGPSGVLGGWALFGQVEFARVESAFSNSVVGGATYVNAFDDPTHNTSVVGTLVAIAGATTGTLRYSGATAGTLILQGHNVIATGGILATVGSFPRITGPAGSDLTAGNGELIIHAYQSSEFQVNAVIAENTHLPVATSLAKSGTGTVTLNSANTYTGTTYINAGLLQIGADNQLHAFTGKGSLLVKPGITLTADAINVGSLTINGTIKQRSVASASKVSSLTIAHTGSGTSSTYTATLDLANNPFILSTTSTADKNTKMACLAETLFIGKHKGDWVGKGITSSTVSADQSATGSHMLSLGLFDNSMLGLTSLGGQDLDSNALFISPALLGDANFDGTVDSTDFNAVVSHWQTQQKAWSAGDLNFDGFVDLLDAVIVSTHWQQQLTPATSWLVGGNPAPVPEPRWASVLPLFLLLTRCRPHFQGVRLPFKNPS